MKKYVMVIMDGAADRARIGGKSPLQLARIPHIDYITHRGVSGLMTTLYDDLHKGSIVAILGMLGYEPHKFYPHGRASCEARAIGVQLNEGDLAFRANLAFMKGRLLDSYNASFIKSKISVALVERVRKELSEQFKEFELYHNSDFRNTLVVRNVNISPSDLICPEPHENMGNEFDLNDYIKAGSSASNRIVARINSYVQKASEILKGEPANVLLPWSASSVLKLHPFRENLKIEGKCALIAYMDFLHGIAAEAQIETFKVGNGDWDTDYFAKGEKLIELLEADYSFVCCHINAPDESSHMGDVERKVFSIEQIDRYVIGPAIKYFEGHQNELGGIIVSIDHYTNHFPRKDEKSRSETHSKDPVPFVFWNNSQRDRTVTFSESDVVSGKYGDPPISHVELLRIFTQNG